MSRTIGLDQLRIAGTPFSRAEGFQMVVHDPRHPSNKKACLGRPVVMDNIELASTYRQLRRGLEESGNAPAAGDFYFGEMQARRRAARSDGRWGEWSLLSAYRGVSSYGLRAVRPLVALAVVVLVSTWALRLGGGFATVLDNDGHRDELDWPATFFYALSAVTSFVRPTETTAMYPDEQTIQFVLRIGGPLLAALTFLAVRNRVKR